MAETTGMASALEARAEFNQYGYFVYPHSLEKLTPVYKDGLIAICVFAIMSLLSVTVLLGFITHRLIAWRKHYREYVGYNQYVILIYNLLLADLMQSIAFSISFHWLRENAILAPTAACFIQGWFLNLGDVTSGFFVLAIACHTWMAVVEGYKMPYIWFVVGILSIWFVSLTLSSIGPAMHQDRFFSRAGGWCWISTDYQDERLWLHYLWIFIVEFGTIAIYGHVFVHLRGRIRSVANNDTAKLTRATKFMVLYPIAYLALTFPLAAGRMAAMGGKELPETFYVIAGALLTSCGWIDAFLYTLTRRVLVNGDISTRQYNRTVNATLTNDVRPGDDYDLKSMPSKEAITSTARTVTIVGGSSRISRLVDHRRGADHRRGRSNLRSKHHDSVAESSPTRFGSQDSIIKPLREEGINILTETNIHVESMGMERVESVSMKERDSSTEKSRPVSEQEFRRQS